MKKYFLYELKKSAFVIACLTVIALVIYLAPLAATRETDLFKYANSSYLAIPSSIGGVLAACVPMWMFHYKMKKRSVDMFFSLPLSHTGVLTVKFLLGMIAIFLPYTVSYWMGAFLVMGRAASSTLRFEIYPLYYLAQYFASLLPIGFLYVISSFVFTRANTFLDGVMFVIFWAFIAGLIAEAIYMSVQRLQPIGSAKIIYPYYYFPFAPLDFITSYFQEKIIIPAEYSVLSQSPLFSDTEKLVNCVAGFTLTTLLAIGAAIGLFLGEKRVKAENAEQISESPFGYKSMIPLYTVCLMAWMDMSTDGSIIFYVIIAVSSFLMTALYKRSVKIGKIQAVVYLCSLALGALLSCFSLIS